MEIIHTTKCNNNGHTFPNNQPNSPRVVNDNFLDSINSKDLLQEFQPLDHRFSMAESPCNPEITFQSSGYDDPFDPFSLKRSTTAAATEFGVHEFNKTSSFEEYGGISGRSVVQDLHRPGGGLFGYPNNNISSTGYNNYSDLSFLSVDNNFQGAKPITNNGIGPEETSCISTAGNGYFMKRRNTNPTKKNGRVRRKEPKITKGQWNDEEDRLLIKLVQKHGVRKWSHIAQIIKGRIGKQCRERWHNHLRPDIKKDVWSEEEDKILIEVHAKVGNKWAEIAKRLPGRTENSIKNHWNATKRRQFSRRKCRTNKIPRTNSLLQDYIKSLNFEKPIPGRTKRNTKTGRGGGATTMTIPPLSSTAEALIQPRPHEFLELWANKNNEEDRLVPDYGFDEVPEFEFPLDNKMFEDSGFDQLMIDDLPPIPEDENDGECFGLEMTYEDLPPSLMQQVGKNKELDLVDIIHQYGN